jgi:flagellar biosynthesis/type III secretory pathway M-ring protein FliF/YscJ
MRLVTVFTSLNTPEADVVFSRLDAADFHPVMTDAQNALGYSILTGGVHVQVPEDEAEEAKEFLAIPGTPPQE